jgi:hypothetical protein
MSDHSHYEELAALAAGGELSDEELTDLQRHAENCAECKDAVSEFRDVQFALPLAQSPFRRYINMITSRPDPGSRERFIRRASLEGIAFSPEVKRPVSSGGPRLSFAAAGAGVLAAIVTVVLYVSHHLGLPSRQLDLRDPTQARQQLDHLTQENADLEATISRLQQTSTAQQSETQSLRSQVATLTAAASHGDEQARTNATQSGSRGAQSLEEAEAQQKAQEKLLADTKVELARVNKARASDQASIVADQIRINELSEQLKTAKANMSNSQRQFMTASGDVPNLMGARQLHVVDVRDTGPDGKPGKAFGRIFLTEGKSLVFYAFDLNDPAKDGAKKTFQVWGQQEGKAGSLRSLGFLNVDNKSQGRWVLKTNDAATFKEINSLFVTVERQGGAKTPDGQRLLFAYLGEANHP